MIRLQDINKEYPTRGGAVQILRDVNLIVKPGERVGILGRNGAGKSTLIRLISGAEFPTNGLVERHMSVSWPLAFGGAFQGSLTGLDNLRFICRIYGADPDAQVDFVQEFSELGIYLREPVKSYSSGMRARLAFAISMVIEFDCFLIDEIIAVGDDRFHQKCNYELFEKRGERAMVIVSHNANYVRDHCDKAAVLLDGQLHHFDDVDAAQEFYAHSQAV
ncbi:MAG: ABC transporter ATP-binding protein [Sphingomicrobium sp.]|jgi:capsular polysaccharide transport system ATP-binding protein